MARFPNTQDPIWLFEGWAEHWAYAISGRQVLLGKGVLAARPDMHPKGLGGSYAEASITSLVKLKQDAFMSQAGTLYPQSWALVDFLLHGEGGRHAEGFKTYVRLVRESPGKANLETCLGVTLSSLGEAYRKHVADVLLPSVRRFE